MPERNQTALTLASRTPFSAWTILILVALASPTVMGQTVQTPQKDLTTTSIEDLMNMEVTSVSKKEQMLSQVAAAIFVITQEEIRRSGATNIPDLLRFVPGLDVAQINGSTWAISARGFNLQFANKLLVLIDGRAVYSPLFGGGELGHAGRATRGHRTN
jgi:iron complex outermembrane receptor protein